jgi:hypothetical protein
VKNSVQLRGKKSNDKGRLTPFVFHCVNLCVPLWLEID